MAKTPKCDVDTNPRAARLFKHGEIMSTAIPTKDWGGPSFPQPEPNGDPDRPFYITSHTDGSKKGG